HRLQGGAAGDRGVVAVAVVGRHPVVGAGGRGRVTRRGGHAARSGERRRGQRRAGGWGAAVGVEGDGAGRVIASDRRLVGDGTADDGAGGLLAGGDRRSEWRDAHRLQGRAAGDRGVVAVAVVGRHPVVGAGGRRRVARRGGHAA